MSIKTENFYIDEKQFTRTYSDNGMLIRGGNPIGNYIEAIDPTELGRTYVETNIPIEDDVEAEEIINILIGENNDYENESVSFTPID